MEEKPLCFVLEAFVVLLVKLNLGDGDLMRLLAYSSV